LAINYRFTSSETNDGTTPTFPEHLFSISKAQFARAKDARKKNPFISLFLSFWHSGL
jgi:hypothetical protein